MMNRKKLFLNLMLLLLTLCFAIKAQAEINIELKRLQEGYPNLIRDISPDYITWNDGSRMRVRKYSPFVDGLLHLFSFNHSEGNFSIRDLQCDSYEPFFKKMYGHSAAEVKRKLVTVYWMPKIFGSRYPLKVTTVNGIDKKIQRISAELEKLPPSDYKYLENPGGSFYWRNVKYERYLSAHSFGIAIDINSHLGNYWLWDWEREKRPSKPLVLRNKIPMRIVRIFEKEGFLWGGRWYFYDTMHFEYRPELFTKTANAGLRYNHELGLRCNA